MLKLLQITDTHLMPPGKTIFGSDPGERLAAAIDDINRNHADAELCVLTGDLAHHADPEAYALLRELLEGLVVPWQLVVGNHDEREALCRAFPEIERDEHGFLQSVCDTAVGRLVFLDSVEVGRHSGAYCERRLAWLERILGERPEEPAFLFLHHPPMAIAMPRLDQYRLMDGPALGDLLVRFPSVRHLFLGHVHRPVSGSWRGIPFSTLRGTNHQNWLDFGSQRENVSSLEPPAYAVAFLDGETTIVHVHDYLDRSPKFVYDPDAPAERQVRPLPA